jgi:glyoxylase-like metal-dependent hydrolase (beta-lactamase superfamily II)
LLLIRQKLASCHIVKVQDSVSLVDVGATQSHPQILKALKDQNISYSDVRFVFVTHVHLDHAGGAGFLLENFFPNAKLVVHPLGAKHMAVPEDLQNAAKQVYGEEAFEKIYGSLVPVPQEKIVLAHHSMVICLQCGQVNSECLLCPSKSKATVFHTPGHARHHYTLFFKNLGAVFTGDTYGLAYPELEVKNKAFIFPTTTPAAFEPLELMQSIETIAGLHAKSVYLTHFGLLRDPAQYLPDLKRRVETLVELILSVKEFSVEERFEHLKNKLRQWASVELENHGCNVKMGLELLEMDIELNVQGLLIWLKRQR